uniref:Uncharacterized protein n=1 Tax=Rhizophora mucronata TaxID=61149 RepID=A0A2P2IZC2_RHIMU
MYFKQKKLTLDCLHAVVYHMVIWSSSSCFQFFEFSPSGYIPARAGPSSDKFLQ